MTVLVNGVYALTFIIHSFNTYSFSSILECGSSDFLLLFLPFFFNLIRFFPSPIFV